MGHRMCSSSTLVLVQLRKTHPEVTERLLTGNQIKKTKKNTGHNSRGHYPCENPMFSSVNVY